MCENLDVDSKECKIKCELLFEYSNTATPVTIIKMLKERNMNKSLCRICLNVINLINYKEQLIDNTSLIDSLALLCDEFKILPSIPGDRICDECIQHITDFYKFKKIIEKIHRHLNAFLKSICEQNVSDYDGLNVHNTLYHYDDVVNLDVNIDTYIRNIEENLKKNDDIETNDYKEFDFKPDFINEDVKTKKERSSKRKDINCIVKKRKKLSYKCKKCFIPFNDKNEYVEHLTSCIVNIENINKICLKSDEKVLKKSLKIVTCYKCIGVFETRDAMLAHRKTCNFTRKLDFKCTYCSEFILKTDKNQHMLHKHSDKRILCNFCNRDFYFKSSLSYHIKNSHRIQQNCQCTVCECTFPNSYIAKEHYCIFKCTYCIENCIHTRYLESYKYQYKCNVQLFNCLECNFKYKYKFELLEHVNSVHLNLPKEYYKHEGNALVSKELKVKKQYTYKYLCIHCGKILSSKKSLNEHVIGHMGKTKCSKCNRTVNLATFDEHLKSHEPGYVRKKKRKKDKKPIIKQCDYCDYQAYYKFNLEGHINKIHLNIRPYTCKVCGKSFHSRPLWKDHERIHDGDKPLCDVCNKQFASKKTLRLHRRLHTGEKPFACDVCGKCYVSPTLKSRHEKIAHGVADQGCDICGKMFYHVSALNKHKKFVHFGAKRKSKKVDL